MKIDIFNTENKYKIIYADPPWSYSGKGCKGDVLKYYKTMQQKDICALPIKNIAEKDSILFMWTTYPKIKEALQTIEAWGFQYKTIAFQWIKTNKSLKNGNLWFNEKSFFFGLGRWTRGNTECCLLATKSKPSRINKSVSQLILSPLTRHSQKPPEARYKIKELLGDLSRIELFARQEIDGWDCWGNEI